MGQLHVWFREYRFCSLQARLSKGEIHLPSAQFPTCHTFKCPGVRILTEEEQVNLLTTTRTFGEFCANTDTIAISPCIIPGKTIAVSDEPSGRFAKAAVNQTRDDSTDTESSTLVASRIQEIVSSRIRGFAVKDRCLKKDGPVALQVYQLECPTPPQKHNSSLSVFILLDADIDSFLFTKFGCKVYRFSWFGHDKFRTSTYKLGSVCNNLPAKI